MHWSIGPTVYRPLVRQSICWSLFLQENKSDKYYSAVIASFMKAIAIRASSIRHCFKNLTPQTKLKNTGFSRQSRFNPADRLMGERTKASALNSPTQQKRRQGRQMTSLALVLNNLGPYPDKKKLEYRKEIVRETSKRERKQRKMKNYEQNPKIKGLWYALFIYIRTLFIRTSRLRLPEI